MREGGEGGRRSTRNWHTQGGLSGPYPGLSGPPSKGQKVTRRRISSQKKLGRIIRPHPQIIWFLGLSGPQGRIIRPPGLRACFAQPDPRSVCTPKIRSQVVPNYYINPRDAPIAGGDHV